ncbi:MAG: tRNA pseudouridine(55) synthase TruB [Anaerolineae bacterium]|nr:tRNA pseudouridine(55) synthase TruB [Anaerolineae bacterium]
MSDGILNLDKPQGPTSHDIVDRVRHLTGIRRVGHAGTLDPMASGVLLVCIGKATRVSEYLMAGKKVYRARVRLGITTDTHDAEGQVVASASVAPAAFSRAEVEAALARFKGTIEQVPPMYSALKHEGKPLHKLAREGIEVKREPRQVEISRLALTEWEPPECTLEVTCSPGTYVRALARDLGQALGCGAHLTGLVRLSSGDFFLEDAVTLETFARAAAEGGWSDLLHPIDAALAHFPALHLDAGAAQRLCAGQAVPPPCPPHEWGGANEPPPRYAGGTEGGTTARVYGPDGAFLALAAYDQADGAWHPHKVFYSPGH